jgi:hypothetical protein
MQLLAAELVDFSDYADYGNSSASAAADIRTGSMLRRPMAQARTNSLATAYRVAMLHKRTGQA